MHAPEAIIDVSINDISGSKGGDAMRLRQEVQITKALEELDPGNFLISIVEDYSAVPSLVSCCFSHCLSHRTCIPHRHRHQGKTRTSAMQQRSLTLGINSPPAIITSPLLSYRALQPPLLAY